MTRRAAWTGIACAAMALTLAPLIASPAPMLLWNATASTPVGLYRLLPLGVLHDGELVAAMPPEPIASFLARGGFLPRRALLLKHVAALAGQTVCRTGNIVTIDGKAAGVALDRDHLDRPLPRWSGCRTLARGEVFLMNRAVPDSLDGRYFGPFPAASIIGQAVPVRIEHGHDAAVRRRVPVRR
jgi:conjugative transfer signal peptidase TraF